MTETGSPLLQLSLDNNGRPAAEEELEPPQEPRLMISKIVCENFKSYAGVKELGPFHKVSLLYIHIGGQ